MRRRLTLAALTGLALLAVLLLGLAVWVRSDHARSRFEALASASLGRDVRVARVDVGWDALELHDLTVSDPWAESPALSVRRAAFEVRWSALWGGGLAGTLRAEAFSAEVRKRGGQTNWHGVRGHRDSSSARPLDIMLVLSGGNVRLHDEDRGETVSIEGAGLSGRVTRVDAQPVVALQARADHVRAHGLAVHDVSVGLGLDAQGAELSSLSASFGHGSFEGRGRVAFDPATSWSAMVDVRDVGLHDELLPVVVAVFPAAAGISSSPEGQIVGRVSMTADIRGAGVTRASILQSLDGTLGVRLDGVVLPRETAVVRVAALLGRRAEPMPLDRLDVAASVNGPWVQVDAVRSGQKLLALPFEGRVSLDGRLELELDVLPLMAAVPAAHTWVRRYTAAVPVRLEGTTSDPIVRPPSAATVAKAMAEAWVERAMVP